MTARFGVVNSGGRWVATVVAPDGSAWNGYGSTRAAAVIDMCDAVEWHARYNALPGDFQDFVFETVLDAEEKVAS